MTIQILPPQLANQIAAGEVVERPASVLKELVENCLDAGATKVEIEVERGGNKSLVIRDNGKGIAKDQLALALARHATSKVATLEDLESILSFGFRGEALASISSVARLTLSSRAEGATEAWQAYAEGRDMAVQVKPTAHPQGTTVEVVDLFFNTPARRRFLRADKTEFTHLEEQLRRIALAKESVHFSLRHNGKLVRQYRPASNDRQRQQRLASICGSAFAERAFTLRSSTDELALTGFLALDDDKAKISDVQYFYVNGRVVRDKLVNHAVRQALEEAGVAQAAGFVLYLVLDPHEVDVNVHPAKHEVRFHQARYVHDFILTALKQGLAQRTSLFSEAEAPSTQRQFNELGAVYQAQSQQLENRSDHNAAVGMAQQPDSSGWGADASRSYASDSRYAPAAGSSYSGNASSGGYGYAPKPLRPQANSYAQTAAVNAYGQLLQTPVPPLTEQATADANQWRLLTQLDQQLLLGKGSQLKLLSLAKLNAYQQKQALLSRLPQGLVGQPLLLPVSLPADVNWLAVIDQHSGLLRRLGIDISQQHQRLVLKTVPAVLRRSDLTKVISELLQWLEGDSPSDEALAAWLSGFSDVGDGASQLWQQLNSTQQDALMAQAIDLPWQAYLEQTHE
ncbi:DNA mismatch repair endonuclease MutL [Ferrimonas senticii]|uniref:DNA mismatch repair endonuclease MutL n=1 Tax=Ferrimonas senticii TaxID=394566 RepID=UPI00041DB9FB|nr:DNA mismatch repair endonuclease MutL [Ferrimonas senticii]